LYDTLASNVRQVDDELNSVAAGTLTGLTFRAPQGLRAAGKGGLLGLALTLAYFGMIKQDALMASLNLNNNKNSNL
jgi:hypothetical protein